jgi:hypothetical protein
MQRIYESDQRPMTLHITILCKGKKCFRVWAEEYGKQNSKYADRVINVENGRTIHFKMPVTPDKLFFACFNVNNPKDEDFQVIIQEEELVRYNIFIDNDTKTFVNLAIQFCQLAGYTNPPKSGIDYQDENRQFLINYTPQITDKMSGRVLNTPARIGHSTGRIEVSADKFKRYTIPMRFAILLHEYSHKYRNPKIGLEISNEFGADINGLYIYLGLGFSKVDAICVFAKVFLKAQSDGNIQRMRKIQDYIRRFERQEFAQKI